MTALTNTRLVKKAIRIVLVALLASASFATTLFLSPEPANAATFSIQTGYYVGSGVTGLAISGIGFQPEFVMIKSSTTAGAGAFKTSAMPANTTAFLSATANNTATQITFTATGFSVGTLATLNSANVIYYYVAVRGSDCSATGTFCVGTYTGNGVSPRDITVGFPPSMTMVKRTTAVSGHFRVASEPANESLFFDTTATDATGVYISAFTATAFTVGATDNTNAAVYYYVAFKDVAGAFDEGTFTGDGTDNRNIAGVGFVPSVAVVKNSNSVTAANTSPLLNTIDMYGDSSAALGVATAQLVDGIQALQTDGFQIGTNVRANENLMVMYHFSFGPVSGYSSSGTFTMSVGSYTGTGASSPITGVGFTPDLVIIKAATAELGVFRTSMMRGDSTAYITSATANFVGGITSLDVDGFTVGTSIRTNTLGTTYHWQAFGNAYDPYTNTGASDFAVGSYYGNGIDDRNITRQPWQPDLVVVKRYGAHAASFRPSSYSGDFTSFFAPTAESSGLIQALNSDGFQIGSDVRMNTAASSYHYFSFKAGTNFALGTYTGNAVAHGITTVGFQPDLLWVKNTSAVNAVQRTSTLTGDATQYFTTAANVADRITGFLGDGFTVGGNRTETNTNAAFYRYLAWRIPVTGSLNVSMVDSGGTLIPSPSVAFPAAPQSFDCVANFGTLGEAAQKLRVENNSGAGGWSVSIAATGGTTSYWSNVGGTEFMDFNDPFIFGCVDGPDDADSLVGVFIPNPSVGTITPESGCSGSNLTLQGQSYFVEGVIDSLTLVSANSSANTGCYYDVTGIELVIPIRSEMPLGEYTINMTITAVAV